jgi:flagellar biosynthesis repressor protein FlbT
VKITFKVSLKANERIYVNGAVIRVDRKTSLEFMNDVNFLLENHVLQADQADTPLKQLYYMVQIMLMAPNDTDAAFNLYRAHMPPLIQSLSSPKIANELKNVDRLVHERSFYEAMKGIRDLFRLETDILNGNTPTLVNSLKAAAAVMRSTDENPRMLSSGAA